MSGRCPGGGTPRREEPTAERIPTPANPTEDIERTAGRDCDFVVCLRARNNDPAGPGQSPRLPAGAGGLQVAAGQRLGAAGVPSPIRSGPAPCPRRRSGSLSTAFKPPAAGRTSALGTSGHHSTRLSPTRRPRRTAPAPFDAPTQRPLPAPTLGATRRADQRPPGGPGESGRHDTVNPLVRAVESGAVNPHATPAVRRRNRTAGNPAARSSPGRRSPPPRSPGWPGRPPRR